MFEPTAENVLALRSRANEFSSTWGRERAEAHVVDKLGQLREANTRDGIDFTSEHDVARVETVAREKWDADAKHAGLTLETDLAVALAIVADEVARQKVLPPTIEPLISRQDRAFEELAGLLIEDKLRARVASMTRAAALEWYASADEGVQAGRRVASFLEAHFESLAFQPDADRTRDAEAAARWPKALAERQMKRVSPDLLTWQQDLAAAAGHIVFRATLSHLRSGRGLAVAPRLQAVAKRGA